MDVKHLCLGVLYSGEASGYDIKKCFESSFKHFFVAGYGSIYPALSSLLAKGMVEVEPRQQQGLPDKKVYRITASGRDAFQRALEATVPRHKVRSEFLVLMHFAHLLPSQQVVAAMDTHLAELTSLETSLLNPASQSYKQGYGEIFCRNYALVSTQALIEYIKTERSAFVDIQRGINRQTA